MTNEDIEKLKEEEKEEMLNKIIKNKYNLDCVKRDLINLKTIDIKDYEEIKELINKNDYIEKYDRKCDYFSLKTLLLKRSYFSKYNEFSIRYIETYNKKCFMFQKTKTKDLEDLEELEQIKKEIFTTEQKQELLKSIDEEIDNNKCSIIKIYYSIY